MVAAFCAWPALLAMLDARPTRFCESTVHDNTATNYTSSSLARELFLPVAEDVL